MLRQEQHIIDLSFPLTLEICLMEITFWKGNVILDKDKEPNIWAKYFPQTRYVSCSWQLIDQGPLKILSMTHPFLWWMSFYQWNNLLSIDCSFFLQLFVEKENDLHPHFFEKCYSIGFVIKNQSFLRLSFWIYSNYWILIKIKCKCIICVFNNQLLHYHSQNKNSNIKKFFHVAFQLFLWTCNFFKFPFIVSSLSFSRLLFVYVWTLGFSSNLYSRTTSFIHISISSFYRLLYSHLQNIAPLAIFTRLCPKIM